MKRKLICQPILYLVPHTSTKKMIGLSNEKGHLLSTTYSPSWKRMTLVKSLNRTPTLLSLSW